MNQKAMTMIEVKIASHLSSFQFKNLNHAILLLLIYLLNNPVIRSTLSSAACIEATG
jgi:multisubunit Na+/H+ antiporter MnhG subunit